jgi:hypothetical protein
VSVRLKQCDNFLARTIDSCGGGDGGGNDNVQFKIDDTFIELNLALSM